MKTQAPSRHISEMRPFVRVALVWGPVAVASAAIALIGYYGEPVVNNAFGLAPNAPLLQHPNGQLILVIVIVTMAAVATMSFCLAHVAGILVVRQVFLSSGKSLFALVLRHEFPPSWYSRDEGK